MTPQQHETIQQVMHNVDLEPGETLDGNVAIAVGLWEAANRMAMTEERPLVWFRLMEAAGNQRRALLGDAANEKWLLNRLSGW
jgi:hypothetical protein